MSCSGSFINSRFVYIDAAKEQDMELTFYADSTFVLQDVNGCNVMGQKGAWHLLQNKKIDSYATLLLIDNTKVKVANNMHGQAIYSYTSNLTGNQYMYKAESYFPIVDSDTIHVHDNQNSLIFRNLNFVKFNGNVEKARIKILEKRIIDKFGKKVYIQTYGEGRSMRKARENLAKCN